MSLAGVVRGAVRLARRVTKSVQAKVTHEAWTGQDATTKPTFAPGVPLQAIVEQGPLPFRNALGETIVVRAVLHILEPVEANGAAQREEPIDPRDRITLPNGVVGAPIRGTATIGDLVDPVTGAPYFHTVALA